MAKALLTNAQLRKTLSAVRSLGSRGVLVHAADTSRFTPAGFSRHCARALVYPSPAERPEAFYAWLRAELKAGAYDVFIPMDDDTLAIAFAHRAELEQLTRLALPPEGSYRIAADKGLTARLAAEAGVPCPRTLVPDKLEQLPQFAAQLGYPLVVKPRHSSGSRGIRVVRHERELLAVYGGVHERFPFPLLQEYIPLGERFDVCLLFDRENKLRCSFVQKELRHFPVDMGPSTVQESVWRPDLLEEALRLMARLPWFGVVELEFMIDPRDGLPKLMEMNPRFWNSLHLAALSGVDFAWALYQAAMGSEVEEIADYRLGVRCRWLLPGDLLHFAANPQRSGMDPPLWGGRGRLHDDIASWSDPLPTVGFALACLRYAFDPKAWRLLFKR